MNIDLEEEKAQDTIIRVIGVGGGGCNAINRMVEANVRNVDLISVNTDLQVLGNSKAQQVVQIGNRLTRGLGAGSDPLIGENAALEDKDRLMELMRGAEMIFLTSGMGGGTGTGATPVIAKLAKEMGALVVAIVTKPFHFEGARRMRIAEDGVSRLIDHVDSMILIPNEKLLTVAERKMTVLSAFSMVDDVLRQGVEGISDLINYPGEINVDFADVKTVMNSTGMALMGTGVGKGDNRAVAAAKNLLALDGLKNAVSLYQDRDGTWFARMGAGTTLSELAEALRSATPANLFYPVDPTETSASVGGTIDTNASGARTLKYGPTRNWVNSITAVLADGSVLTLQRGQTALDNGDLHISRSDGTRLIVPLRPVALPSTKHTAGYFVAPEMDPIDLLIGGEGTLCITTEAELKLATLPGARLCLVLFLSNEDPASIVGDLLSLRPAAIEYMDRRSLDLLRDAKNKNEDAGAVPDMPGLARGALYVEFEGQDDSEIEEIFGRLEVVLERHDISENQTWAGFDQSDLDAMKAFRHALPERINTIVGERKRGLPELTKVGTDMAVPFGALEEMLRTYATGLENSGLEYCVFGHIGNAHLHVNILPRSMAEVELAYGLYRRFAEAAVRLGGSVAGEHGIGRLKKQFMDIQYESSDLASMREIKKIFDPKGVLNPGVM